MEMAIFIGVVVLFFGFFGFLIYKDERARKMRCEHQTAKLADTEELVGYTADGKQALFAIFHNEECVKCHETWKYGGRTHQVQAGATK